MLDLQKKLDLSKKTVLDISKSLGIGDQHSQVVLCLDYSGSMDHLYASGHVQQVLERIVPVAMAFDDNGEMELIMFHNRAFRHPNNVTSANVDGLVKREITGRYSWGGTSYAPPIEMITKEVQGASKATSQGGGWFSKGTTTYQANLPTYVIFITDGENSDKSDAVNAIRNASYAPVFFQFVGIGRESFEFLRKLDDLEGRYLDNANFFKVDSLTNLSDEELYGKLLAEYPSWLKEARAKSLI